MATRQEIFDRISAHRDKIDLKYDRVGFTGLEVNFRNTILGEEVGEVSNAILERDRENLENELYDVAQVIVAWLETIDA